MLCYFSFNSMENQNVNKTNIDFKSLPQSTNDPFNR